VAHPAGARREDGEIGAALALEPELGPLEAVADLVVGDLGLIFTAKLVFNIYIYIYIYDMKITAA
jgi:hypothetical protein